MSRVLSVPAPTPLDLPYFETITYATATAAPCGLSRDRATIYGSALPGVTTASASQILYQSVDDGVTWTTVHTFAQNVYSVLETDDGEALVVTRDPSFGYLWKSTGWAASHTAATWTLVLQTPGGYIQASWGSHWCSFGDDSIRANTSRFGIINNYGQQTTASGSQATKAVYAWTTNDYGATWTQVFDLTARYPSVASIHIHSTAYDPYWDRLWMTYGDTDVGTGGATGNMLAMYSDDRGATWVDVPSAPEWVSTYRQQPTTISVLPDCVILHNDSRGGPWRIARAGYRKMGTPQQMSVIAGTVGEQMISTGSYRHRSLKGAPLIYGITALYTNVNPAIYASRDDGQSFVEVWRDDSTLPAGAGVLAVYGPTAAGTYLARVDQSGDFATGTSQKILRAKLPPARPVRFGDRLARKVATSTGTSTFTPTNDGLYTDLWTTMTVTFTAPPSGAVEVALTGNPTMGSNNEYDWNLRDTNGDIAGTGTLVGFGYTGRDIRTVRIPVTGLTPGQSYTWKWGHAQTATVAAGNTKITPTSPLRMDVFAA